jgi:competence protein ComGC
LSKINASFKLLTSISDITRSKKGFNLVEMLAAFTVFSFFTVFSLCILAILNVIYQAMNLEFSSKNIDIAIQNIRIIENYLKYSNSIVFIDNLNDPIGINDTNLIKTNDDFDKLNAPPLDKIKFNKPELFERNIKVQTFNNFLNKQYSFGNNIAVFTITLRWKEKGFYKKVSVRTTISRDRR